jgi:hypothetical protein
MTTKKLLLEVRKALILSHCSEWQRMAIFDFVFLWATKKAAAAATLVVVCLVTFCINALPALTFLLCLAYL